MLYKGVEIYQTESEIDCLRQAARLAKDLEGVFVEVGVYEGASALVLSEECPDKELELYDTFEGFPDTLHTTLDSSEYYPGLCKGSIETVLNLFASNPKVKIIQGVFPESSKLKGKKIALAHIDVDIYESTRGALEEIFPKMVDNGIVVLHDYHVHTGVRKAVDDYLKDKTYETLPLNGMRQLVIKA